MKSNKQRRAQIKARRLERAGQLAREPGLRDVGALKAGRAVPGIVLADGAVLAQHNNGVCLPGYYVDRAFRCRDCGQEEVWTAKQQKWWFEVVHASIESRAVRCLACRRAHRVRLAASRAGVGADLLREQGDRLRALGACTPDAQARAEVEAALCSKWWGLRVVAIETLGRWGGVGEVARLNAFVAQGAACKYWSWERQAADAARKALHGCGAP